MPPPEEFTSQRATGPNPDQRDIHGILFGTMGKPTHVLVPGFRDSRPERFAAWLDDLRSDGWEVTLTPAISFEGVLIAARRRRSAKR